MEIHLIRHTAVENPENLCYGFADMPLRQGYLEDFKSIDLDNDFDLVISSPASRCCLLAEYFKLTYKTDERIREMNFGNWELRKWSEIPEEEINPWYNDFVNIKASGGENLLEMQTRVLSFWNELIAEENNGKVLIITHAGVIRLILQTILKFPLENMFNIQIDYGKKVIVTVDDQLFSIKKINI
ncbi:alpha-ribazole phosphatase [Chryseobacterium lactis]|uniref:Alpha-ribazole phosphatase n=1 Tax=Chryseobacterium lactis TaxID=1241981 RepID=A0A3G6RDI3_CHRLC|nr:alpha-ribazole phosphatase family protein [Chryseobacterium lactis]AZA82769.1 alpha-ribazole phosphatase [Chryseobacterium lactis]AZB03151.1 alpha-ribazole phosphatase [Chryseobacterium lactis]PNW11220.1 alpha-ribazole phosphatase [Chryseobacterium lactis]